MFKRYAARVAVVGPLSGPRAAWGRLLTDAVTQAAGDVRWVMHDDRGDAALAEHRAEQIVLDGGYSAVVGHFNSRGARAALPLYRKAGIACMLPLATDPLLTSLADGLVLRWCATDGAQARALLAALAAAGHATVHVVTDGTPQMSGLTRLLLTAEPCGVGVRRLAQGRSPGRAPGRASDDPGAVVVVAAHHEAAAMARGLRARGFRGQLAFTDDCAVPEFAELAGEAAAGALVTVQPGGPASRVNAAVAALDAVLDADPSLAGRGLVRAVRELGTAEFDAAGELASGGWTVQGLLAATPRLAA